MTTLYSAEQWRMAVEDPSAAFRHTLESIYGPDNMVIESRLQLLHKLILRFLERFGDAPLRVFRTPGRINLRGMHVDTHGGYLNLMTHQREVLLAVTPTHDQTCQFVNIDPEFGEVAFSLNEEKHGVLFEKSWSDFINHETITTQVRKQKGAWANYLKGALLRVQHAHRNQALTGMRGVVGSDLPRGAALSSSAALILSVINAALALNELSWDENTTILAGRDAEWYTGARTGTSDQAAEVLGGKNEIVNVALLAEDFDTQNAQRMPLPGDARILVINSYTKRSLSGAQLVAYTQNRFAYSLAMHILLQELDTAGFSSDTIQNMDRFSRITPENMGGLTALYQLLQRIPEKASLNTIRNRYAIPDLESLYEKYFGGVAAEQRPQEIGLRGPLLFGLAESERARHFFSALQHGQLEYAGKLMSIGHDGDRLFTPSNQPYSWQCNDETLAGCISNATPIEHCPGSYGASSRVLDLLVDTALAAGALGASLTGGGIAGTVLALCRKETAGNVAEALCTRMAQDDYMTLTRRNEPLTKDEIEQAVVINHAPEGAGELCLMSTVG